ncbi:ABC transporter ATP-binding protein [Sphingomonas sp.]|uniref:ABC transporter ATP-binding protein n=1 Tax=Sphingomonas sp. TaxID=28214 RepID=UPI00286DFA06|nr:ABC transporter ATP-binding protein [Sphingomonas sp.]
MTSLLEAHAVTIAGRLAPTDLAVPAPALIALIGPNGGGKTSLLRALADAEKDGGSVVIDSEVASQAPPARRPHLLTFLPASRAMTWPIAARDVIALGLPRPDPDRIDELVAEFELEDLASRPIDRLSTGERARVLLARALAPRPRLLLLDEPLSNLDPYWVVRTLAILRGAVTSGSAAIVALHDLAQLASFDRALLVDCGQVLADAIPSEILKLTAFGDAFRVEPSGTGWRVRPPADPRSSP